MLRRTILLTGAVVPLWLASPAMAGLTTPSHGAVYTIPHDQIQIVLPTEWSYAWPAGCKSAPHVTYFETEPGRNERIRSGGPLTKSGGELSYALVGSYRARTRWRCIMEGDSPSTGDDYVDEGDFETIAFTVVREAAPPASPPPPLPPAPPAPPADEPADPAGEPRGGACDVVLERGRGARHRLRICRSGDGYVGRGGSRCASVAHRRLTYDVTRHRMSCRVARATARRVLRNRRPHVRGGARHWRCSLRRVDGFLAYGVCAERRKRRWIALWQRAA